MFFSGKWHLGHHTEDYLPTNRGFDTFRGTLLGSGDHYTHTKYVVLILNVSWRAGSKKKKGKAMK